jgi:CRP-like cAMP-binding protein
MRKALELLGRLNDADIEWLVENGAQSHVETGSILIHEGVPIDSLYILLDGQLEVSIGRERRKVATLLSGEIVGEISFVDPRPPSATVRASTGAHVLRVPRDRLHKKLGDDAPFAARFYLALASCMATRLRNTTDRLGYGQTLPVSDPDELEDSVMEEITIAAVHFRTILQRLRGSCVATPA